jgi:hypothetical protein
MACNTTGVVSIRQGEVENITLNGFTNNGEAYDITGLDVTLVIGDRNTDWFDLTGALYSSTVTSDGNPIVWTIPDTVTDAMEISTGQYFYDIQLSNNLSTGLLPITVTK